MSGARRPRRFLVLGGGCFGRHHATSLLRARGRGRLSAAEVWVIDRDPGCSAAALAGEAGLRVVTAEWEEFFARYLEDWQRGAGVREEDLIVPTPFAPQLFPRWLARALAGRVALAETAPPVLPDTPLARLTGGRLALSFAEWRCPIRCIEPAVCPVTRQPRTWEISLALASYARRLREAGLTPLAGPFLGRVTHLVEGVSGFPAMDWTLAARRLAHECEELGSRAGLYVLAGVVSGCHGAATLLRAGPADGACGASAATDPA